MIDQSHGGINLVRCKYNFSELLKAHKYKWLNESQQMCGNLLFKGEYSDKLMFCL